MWTPFRISIAFAPPRIPRPAKGFSDPGVRDPAKALTVRPFPGPGEPDRPRRGPGQWSHADSPPAPGRPAGERVGRVPGRLPERGPWDDGLDALGRAHAVQGRREAREGGPRPPDLPRRREGQRLHGQGLDDVLRHDSRGAPADRAVRRIG